MDRDDLEARIDSYTHRFGANSADILTFIEDVRTRIGEDLRCAANFKDTALVVTDGQVELPADFRKVYGLFRFETVGSIVKEAIEPVTISFLQSQGQQAGEPDYFAVDALAVAPETQGISLFPQNTSTVYLYYFSVPDALTLGADTNQVLSDLPMVYLFACLRLAGLWAGDGKYYQAMTEAYDDEVRRANRAFRLGRFTDDSVGQGTHSFGALPTKGV